LRRTKNPAGEFRQLGMITTGFHNNNAEEACNYFDKGVTTCGLKHCDSGKGWFEYTIILIQHLARK
jgi:hypothetical protein